MGRVVRLGCEACRLDGVLRAANLHHIREGYGAQQRASHWEVIPLCEGHHQGMLARKPGEPKLIAFHGAERTFKARYGNEVELLEGIWKRLGMNIEQLPELRGSEPPWWEAYKAGRLVTTTDLEARLALTEPIEEDLDDVS